MGHISVGGEDMKHNDHGFSMVEIIIVIAIMAILAGALAPVLIRYVNQSRKTADVTSGDNLGQAAQIALTDARIADYVLQQQTPFSVDITDLTANDLFVKKLAEIINSAPTVKYRKTGGTNFQITIYHLDDTDTSYGVEVTVKGATVTSTSGAASTPKGDGAMVYPEVDASYQ